jgi:hypothetical protein
MTYSQATWWIEEAEIPYIYEYPQGTEEKVESPQNARITLEKFIKKNTLGGHLPKRGLFGPSFAMPDLVVISSGMYIFFRTRVLEVPYNLKAYENIDPNEKEKRLGEWIVEKGGSRLRYTTLIDVTPDDIVWV